MSVPKDSAPLLAFVNSILARTAAPPAVAPAPGPSSQTQRRPRWEMCQYLDVRLSDWGACPLADTLDARPGRGLQRAVGESVVFFCHKAQSVVHGTVVKASGGSVFVSPVRREGGPEQWVELDDVFTAPSNITALRAGVNAFIRASDST